MAIYSVVLLMALWTVAPGVAEPSSPPENVSIKSCERNSVVLTWDAPRDGPDGLFYWVFLNLASDPGHWINYRNISGDSQERELVVPPGGVYRFRLKASNNHGYYTELSDPTPQTCAKAPEQPYENPKDVHTVTDTEHMLIVVWRPMARLLQNGPDFRYIITWWKHTVQGREERYQVLVNNPYINRWETFVPDTYASYGIIVQAANALGLAAEQPRTRYGFSGEGKPRVQPDRFRLDPDNAVEPHRAYVIWNAVNPSRTMIQGEFQGYKIRYWKASEDKEEGREVLILITEEDRSLQIVRETIDDLPASTAFRAEVSAINTYHTGPPSQALDFSTPDAGT